MSRWLLLLALVPGCDGGLSQNAPTGSYPTDPYANDTDDTDINPPGNDAPVADAGPDDVATVTDVVQLDGSNSFDVDGDALAYSWSFVSLPSASTAWLVNDSRSDPTFFADRPGDYVVELVVDDGIASDSDEVTITVDVPNAGPVANAGQDKQVVVGARVQLNGTNSFDPDGDPLFHTWTFNQKPAGSTAVLDDPSLAMPSFTADVQGVYLLSLIVTDGTDSSPPDQIRVTASPPSTSSGGCFSCTADGEVHRRLRSGDLTSGFALVFMPLLIVAIRRRRR